MKAEEPAQLVVDAEQRVARVIVKVAEVDVAVEAPLKKVLRDAAKADVGRLEIDLSGVSFADSRVVGLALQVREWVAPRGARVAIKAPAAIRRLFELTETSHHFEIIETA